MEFIKFDSTGAMPYFISGWAKMVNNCNGFLAINTGDDIVEINDHVLYPGVPGTNNGDTFMNFGHIGEIFTGTIKIVFRGVGANPSVTIDQKFYSLPNAQVI